MFAFNLKKYILEVGEKIVLRNFDTLYVSNKRISVRKPRFINPCYRLSHVNLFKGFLFLGFLSPLNLKTGSNSLNSCDLIKTVIYNRLKKTCSVLAITTGDVRLKLLKVLNEFGVSSYNMAHSYLGAVSLISRRKIAMPEIEFY